jgi:uncharacterized protein YcfJ
MFVVRKSSPVSPGCSVGGLGEFVGGLVGAFVGRLVGALVGGLVSRLVGTFVGSPVLGEFVGS